MKFLLPPITVSISLILAASSFSSFAFAQPNLCADRAVILGRLSADYAEVPVARGLANDGTMLEVVAAPDGGSWTIILTAPDGPSCLVAAGEGWQIIEPPPGGTSM